MPAKPPTHPYRLIIDRRSMIDASYQRKAVVYIDSGKGEIRVTIKKPYAGKAVTYTVAMKEPLTGAAAVAYALNEIRDKL